MIPRTALRARHAFTLIEMMVVILILLIIAGTVIAIGSQTKITAQRKSTLNTLKVLDGMMKDYLATGNPEPLPVATSAWTYGPPNIGSYSGYNGLYYGNPVPPLGYLPTATPSDPINWVKAFQMSPDLSKKLSTLNTSTDIMIQGWGTSLPSGVGRTPVQYDANGTPLYPPLSGGKSMIVLDAWGTPIRYVPSQAGKLGYFVSAGPDGKFFDTPTSVFQGGYAGNSGFPATKNDDMYSTDPQLRDPLKEQSYVT